jgi:phosphatidylethanolamine-binding protein (PEBP) family uncharacterized protein
VLHAIERGCRVGSLAVRRLVAFSAGLIVVSLAASGCRHDGRNMRPALPSQDGSVSTSVASTVPETDDGFFDTEVTNVTEPTDATDAVDSLASSSSTSGLGTTTTSTSAASSTAAASTLAVTAPWRDGAPIDARYSCKGENLSPALSWPVAPAGTVGIAITMVDLDFTTFNHWAQSGIAADATALPEGTGAGYQGPCPPAGAPHTYVITVHYLKAAVTLPTGPVADIRAAIDAATIAIARVAGTFTTP